jgi:hypothetical protein
MMPDQGEKRFSLSTRSVERDEVNDTVSQVQQYLGRFGYLQAAYEPSRLDEPTQDALRLFQQRVGIPQTGIVDDETAAALEKRRCSVPDMPSRGRAVSAVPPAFVAGGCDYEGEFRTLTYAFLIGTSDLPGRQELQAIRNAFATWQQQISVDFEEVGAANNPNFSIGWFTGAHGDDDPFDGVGNTLAHAYYPPPCGGTHSGKMHFDDAEVWALAGGANRFDVETVALHEIGHLLGLGHSTVVGSVMFPFIEGVRRNLSQDDIDGIRSLYGRRGPSLEVLVHLQGIGDSAFRENEFAGTRGQSKRLEGFQLTITPAVPGLSVRYMAHLQSKGDVPFVGEGKFVGTRGEHLRLEGFAIELTGSAAGNFSVFYMAHLQGRGDTGFFQNGQFCGTRGEQRPVEGILVRIDPK